LKPNERIVAACQVFLVVPALLFLVALLARGRQPIQTIVALDAQAIVTWYAARQWTLWLLLIALPAAALIIGFFDLAARSQSSEQRSANLRDLPRAPHPSLRRLSSWRPERLLQSLTWQSSRCT